MALRAPSIGITTPTYGIRKITSATEQERDLVKNATSPAGGKTAAPPSPNDSFVGAIGQAIGGAIVGGISGGGQGAVAGAIGGLTGSCPTGYVPVSTPLGTSCSPIPGAGSTGSSLTTPAPTACPPGYTKVGSTCVKPSAALPGGQPLTVPAQGTQVANYGEAQYGMYGLALGPAAYSETRMKCPPGMVLGKDNLCYNKSDLRKNERKWRPRPKPPVTAADAKAIRRAASAKNRVERLAKRTGLHVYKSARRSR